MHLLRKVAQVVLVVFVLVVIASDALAADLDAPCPDTSEASDQKAGSSLFYNIYILSATTSNSHNTRISITNTNPTSAVTVHTGYITAFAGDNLSCCAIRFNFLNGVLEYCELGHGCAPLDSVQHVAKRLIICPFGFTQELVFDGTTGYHRLPLVLAVNNIPARADSNDTLLIINRERQQPGNSVKKG